MLWGRVGMGNEFSQHMNEDKDKENYGKTPDLEIYKFVGIFQLAVCRNDVNCGGKRSFD